jgi:hypothetical protein
LINTTRIVGILYEATKRPYRIDEDWLDDVMGKISLIDPELVTMLKDKAAEIKNELMAKRMEKYDAR